MVTQSISAERSRAWVDVDLGALLRNARALQSYAKVPLLPMVKADAYGLGAVQVARALEQVDPIGFGIASVAEGEELRAAGIGRPILVFTPIRPSDFSRLRAARITPTLGDPEVISAWIASGGGDWHLAIETGMYRAGLRWDRIADITNLLLQAPPVGAFTHFHSSDRNDGSLERQEELFARALSTMPSRPTLLHTENSAAIVRRTPSPWSFVRPGVFLYGVGSGDHAALQPEAVAHLRAPIVEIRELLDGETVSYDATYRAVGKRRIATLPCGYADGYRRALGNRGTALIGGRPVPVAGVVTMDMTMLDVTEVTCAPGDVATLLGRDGDAELSAESVARTAEMSPYELLTGLRQRAPRLPIGAP